MIAPTPNNPNIPTTAASARPAQNSRPNTNPSNKPDGRPGMEALAAPEAGLTDRLKEMGKEGASKLGNVAGGLMTAGAKQATSNAVTFALKSQMMQIASLMNMPGTREMISMVIRHIFHPYYQKLNPNTTTTADEIIEQLKEGNSEFLEKDLFVAFDKFIKDSLPDDASRARYEAGDKMVLLSAFTQLAKKTATEPGAFKKLLNGIADKVPFSAKIPTSIKPFIGAGAGLIGLKIAYGVLKIVLRMTFGMLQQLPIIGGFFGGGNYPPQEMVNE